MTTEATILRENISPRTEKWIRISAILAMIIVAVSSAVLSFDGLQKVALAAQIPAHLAFLFPIAVDTTILMGSLAVLLYELFGVRAVFGWVTVLFGTFLSIVGNVISVKDAGLIAQVLHGIIPVLLCISLESLLRILRFNIKRARALLEEKENRSGRAGDTTLTKTEEENASQPVTDTYKNRSPVVADKSTEQPVPQNLLPTPDPVISKNTSDDENGSYENKQAVKESAHSTAPASVPSKATDTDEKEVVTPAEPSVPVSQVNPPDKPSSVSSKPVSAPIATVPAEPVEKSVEKPTEPVVDAKTSVDKNTTDNKSSSTNSTKAVAKPVVKTDTSAGEMSEQVEKYRIIIESQNEDTPKARKVAEVLAVYPDASGADLKKALGDPPELRIDGTVRRAKEWLKKNRHNDK